MKPVSIPAACQDGAEPGNNGGDGGRLCGGLRLIVVVVAILAALASIIGACISGAAATLFIIAVALGIAAGLLGIIWGIFCPKPCGAEMLLAWQFSFGVGFGVLYFILCCPLLWALAVGSVAVDSGLLALWLEKCKKGLCDVVSELLVAISGVSLPLLGWLGLIPALSGCVNPWVSAGLSAFAGLIAIAAAACAANPIRRKPGARGCY
jgi:hypothetical protein